MSNFAERMEAFVNDRPQTDTSSIRRTTEEIARTAQERTNREIELVATVKKLESTLAESERNRKEELKMQERQRRLERWIALGISIVAGSVSGLVAPLVLKLFGI